MESDDEDIGFKRKRIEEKKKAKAKNSKKT